MIVPRHQCMGYHGCPNEPTQQVSANRAPSAHWQWCCDECLSGAPASGAELLTRDMITIAQIEYARLVRNDQTLEKVLTSLYPDKKDD